MEFVSRNVGQLIEQELGEAKEVTIAVAYFRPGDSTLDTLQSVESLKLCVSAEFTINNPYSLEELSATADIRCISPGFRNGRLHAKVFRGTRSDGSIFVYVGSANLTNRGFFDNQEAGIFFDSNSVENHNVLEDISSWLDTVWNQSNAIDFDRAKEIYDSTAAVRWNYNTGFQGTSLTQQFWVLKTREGHDGPSNWDEFLQESVIAIGWDINVNAGSTSQQIEQALRRKYPRQTERSYEVNANTIGHFLRGFSVGDIVLICDGYPPNMEDSSTVKIYGVARVLEPPIHDSASTWWKLKRRAEIQVIDRRVRKDLISRSLGKNSMMKTIHEITASEFQSLSTRLHTDHDVIIDI